jgi:hypothetical protein
MRALGTFFVELLRGAAALVAGIGLLYLVAPFTRGLAPSVPDALPLDELPRHASVSLWMFVAVWLGVAWAVRSLDSRPSAAPWMAVVVLWLWSFGAAVISIAVVRQISAATAAWAALTAPAPYLATALFAGGTIRWRNGYRRVGSAYSVKR